MGNQTLSPPHGLIPFPSTLQQIRNGDNIAFERLLDRWEPIIRSNAEGFTAPGCDIEDFQQVGRLALYRAVFTYSTGAQFHTYANRVIVRAMIDEQRLHANEAMPRDVDAAVQEPVVYDDPLVAAELTDSINRWQATLNAQQQQIVSLLFFGAGMKQAVVAGRMSLTTARISQIVRTIRTLARYYELN